MDADDRDHQGGEFTIEYVGPKLTLGLGLDFFFGLPPPKIHDLTVVMCSSARSRPWAST